MMAFRTAIGCHLTEMMANVQNFMNSLTIFKQMDCSDQIEVLKQCGCSVLLAESCIHPEGILHYGMNSQNYQQIALILPEFDNIIRPTDHTVWKTIRDADLGLVEQSFLLINLIFLGKFPFPFPPDQSLQINLQFSSFRCQQQLWKKNHF